MRVGPERDPDGAESPVTGKSVLVNGAATRRCFVLDFFLPAAV